MTILVFGSANIDLSVSVRAFPKVGETVHARDYRVGLGGKGVNQAVAAQRLYRGLVRFVGAVGADHFGELVAEHLEQLHVSTRDLRCDSSQPTGVALIHVDQAGQNAITVAGGANLAWTEADLQDHLFEQVSVGLCQLETPIHVTCEVLRRMRAKGALTILDPAPIPESAITDLFPYVDILTPNWPEAEQLLGCRLVDRQQAIDGAAALCRRGGFKSVLITLGEDGVAYSERGGSGQWMPAVRVQAVDTVGAGDCFNGALATALAEGNPLDTAIRFAMAAAAVSVTAAGAAAAMPTRDAVDRSPVQS